MNHMGGENSMIYEKPEMCVVILEENDVVRTSMLEEGNVGQPDVIGPF